MNVKGTEQREEIEKGKKLERGWKCQKYKVIVIFYANPSAGGCSSHRSCLARCL